VGAKKKKKEKKNGWLFFTTLSLKGTTEEQASKQATRKGCLGNLPEFQFPSTLE